VIATGEGRAAPGDDEGGDGLPETPSSPVLGLDGNWDSQGAARRRCADVWVVRGPLRASRRPPSLHIEVCATKIHNPSFRYDYRPFLI
jgi:hypothetical protein